MSGDESTTRISKKIRVLVVDDSAFNRRTIADLFLNHPDIEVVGRAGDGEDALRQEALFRPDVITLDLEMPRMDGFTFLRILMSRRPTHVVVISSYAQKENVFKALELGAIDFVAKPDRWLSDSDEIRQQILEKVLMVRNLRPAILESSAKSTSTTRKTPPGGMETIAARAQPERALEPPKYVVAIGCSTGGPSALLEIVGRLSKDSVAAFVIAQHMPDKFTRTFADRLGRRGTIRVTEALDGDILVAGAGFVCPGRQCMEVSSSGDERKLRVVSASPSDRYVPSADRLFRSVAQSFGPRAIGVVLTGMGDDGTAGARAIRAAGGTVIAESQETAIVYGMPGSVVREELANEVLPLPAICQRLFALS